MIQSKTNYNIDNNNKIVLSEDLIIPKGTEFSNIDNTQRDYINGNYEALIGYGKDAVINIVICEDVLDKKNTIFSK